MLKKYMIVLEDNAIHKEQYFLDALRFIHKYRGLTKGDVPTFMGMRNTWFPCALLRLGTVHHMTNANVIRNSRELYSKYVREKATHSWYFIENSVVAEDYHEEYGSVEYRTNVVYFKAKEEDLNKMNRYLKPIMDMFGLRYTLSYIS